MSYDKKDTKLPESAIKLLIYLEEHGKKTQKEIIHELNLPIRSVRYAIRRLIEQGYINKMPNLFDMRSVFYEISESVMDIDALIAEQQALIKA